MTEKLTFPPIGGRILKSALVVYICLLLDIVRGETGVPFYSAIAALLCIQPYWEDGKKTGWNRICGTLIGALWGTVALTINLYFVPESYSVIRYGVMSLFIIPVIYTAVVLHKNPSTFIACVVLLSINVNHLGDENPYMFVVNRVIDTLLGVGVALAVNAIHLPRKRNKDILFVSKSDNGILKENQELTPHDRFRLNRMIDAGAYFTFSTYGSPATARELADGIHMKQPAIILDGAVLYDLKKHLFHHKIGIPYDMAMEILQFVNGEDVHCFATCLVENTLLTYVGEFHNEMEAKIYEKGYTSPFWNYIHGSVPQGTDVVYLMVVDTEEKILGLQEKLQNQIFGDKIKVNVYMQEGEPGYLHMKIYSSDASPEKMVKYMLEKLQEKESVKEYRIVSTVNEMVKAFEPVAWSKN